MKLLTIFLLLIIGINCYGENWESPIDTKYKNKNIELFLKFEKERNTLNKWTGQRQYLSNAHKTLTSIIKQDHQFAPAYRELGRMYIMYSALSSGKSELELLETAKENILKSIQLEPEYADSYVLLGHLYTTIHDMKSAEKALLKATEIGTKSPWLNLNFAQVYKYKRQYEKEYQAYLNVIKSDTKNNKALLTASSKLKEYYEKRKDYVNADIWFEKSMKYSKENAWAWGNHASVLIYTRGDFDKGIEYAEKALSIMNYGLARSILADGLYSKWSQELKLGNTLKANEYYIRAYELNPNLETAISEMSKFEATREASKSLEIVLQEAIKN